MPLKAPVNNSCLKLRNPFIDFTKKVNIEMHNKYIITTIPIKIKNFIFTLRLMYPSVFSIKIKYGMIK